MLLEAEIDVDLGETDEWGWTSIPSRVWARLYPGFVTLHGARDGAAVLVVPVIMAQKVAVLDPCTLCLSSQFERYELSFAEPDTAQAWRAAMETELAARRALPFGAAAPPRPNTPVTFFIDGEAYFAALADVLAEATESILIADWCFTPETLMTRPSGAPLIDLLAHRVASGVDVYVLLYGENALELGSERAARQLEAIGARVVRHSPSWEDIYYSHHQKLVVVDRRVAFVGGLDLTFGRWDTHEHPVTGGASLFPGIDYYNPTVREPTNADIDQPQADVVNRERLPRWPWHDVQCQVEGEAARDIAFAFVQRWNQHQFEIGRVLPAPIGLGALRPRQRAAREDGATVQVLRSQAHWNGGAFIETSICRAWIDAIENARRFLYIEQQFFISSLAGPPVRNRVGEAILERISRAIREDEQFEVIVVLPVQPSGDLERDVSARAILHWQLRTIARGGSSLLEQLRARFPAVDLSRYVGFFALRNHGTLHGRAVTAPVYVHSKLIIADDKIAVVGSANLNDRSMSGVRDSEIAVRVHDEGGAVRALREDLWRHLLGLDAIGLPALPTWHSTAWHNTQIYTDVFPWVPEASHSTFAEIRAGGGAPRDPSRLASVRGFVVRYPLGLLDGEDLSPQAWELQRYLGPEIYT
jgi:phospholipase D1/2